MAGKKRSILHNAPQHWIGWPRIMTWYNRAVRLDADSDRPSFYALYFVTFFLTGGRKAEVVHLRPSQIFWNDDVIKIENMDVLKRRKRFTRNVLIKIEGNPLASIFIDFVKNCKTEYLLPGYGSRFSSEIDPEKHISTAQVYRKICEIDPDLWPHLLRDQRSWHLAADLERGGRGMDVYLLKEWFEWASIEMPAHYAGRRKESDILKHFGVQDIKHA